LKIGLSADVPDLKPSRDQGAAAMMLDTLIHRGLLGYDAQGKVVPALAESFTPSADNKSFTVKLRKGLKFSDGSALTSANVKKTLEFLATSASGAKIDATMSKLESVETPDDLTAIVKLKGANVAFPSYLADTTAAILPDKAFSAQGTSWEGAGPFKLDTTQKGVSFTFTKNPEFYDAARVNFEKVIVTVYADGQARLNALLATDVSSSISFRGVIRPRQQTPASLDPQSGRGCTCTSTSPGGSTGQ
jgi:ABC-type transport system substrate-binding protein